MWKKLDYEIVHGVTDGITYSGTRQRRQTVLLRIGKRAISKQALQLGVILAVMQFLDGLLTYAGVSILGVNMEGNSFIRVLMHAYGSFPALFLAKIFAVVMAFFLTMHSHRRRWIRPIIVVLCLFYLALAVVPWTYIISKNQAKNWNSQELSEPKNQENFE